MSKPIDATARRLGAAMRVARQACHLTQDEAATLLNILPNELAEYERGSAQIPVDILQRALAMGYMMIHIKTLDNKYRMQRHILRKIRQGVADVS